MTALPWPPNSQADTDAWLATVSTYADDSDDRGRGLLRAEEARGDYMSERDRDWLAGRRAS